MDTSVRLFAPNAMICGYCTMNFYVSGGEFTARHPEYEDLTQFGFHINPLVKTCPNAGKTFQLPVCQEI